MVQTSSSFFKSCHHKIRVQQANGNFIYVDCGTCPYCINKKADISALLCSIEESSHRYCFVSTLTYRPDKLPKLKPIKTLLGNGTISYLLRSQCHRDADNYGKVLSSIDSYPEDKYQSLDHYVSSIQDKCKENGSIGYSCKTDLQKFFKRLRINLKRKGINEKIRYFAVSEYGPCTFRPHFHICFYFDNAHTFRWFRHCVFKSWRYGRKDCELSKRRAHSYIASYINSSSKLPVFYSDSKIRPFQSHSNYFACKNFDISREEIYESPFTQFVGKSLQVFGKTVDVRPWRALLNRFFPKVQGFSTSSKRMLRLLYTSYSTASKLFCQVEDDSPKTFTESFIEALHDETVTYRYPQLASFIDQISDLLHLNDDIDPYFVTAYQRLYRLFLVSKFFIEYIEPYYLSAEDAVDAICDFYDYNELLQLRYFYTAQELVSEQYKLNRNQYVNILLSFYYDRSGAFFCDDTMTVPTSIASNDNTMYYLESNPYFQQEKHSSCLMAENRIKHKKLSDANDRFR